MGSEGGGGKTHEGRESVVAKEMACAKLREFRKSED